MLDTVLDIQDLHVHFHTFEGTVRALEGVNLSLRYREVLGLVGETGCGKSVCGLSILRCVPEPGEIVGGRIFLGGEDLLSKTERQMRMIRGKKICMIFQDPTSSLNPVLKVGEQLMDVIKTQKPTDREARERAVEALKAVMLPDPEVTLNRYPHQLSRGMRQRVMIAMAISSNPLLLIADEPTTALDVTIQAEILRLIKKLQERTGASILLITHDLGVVAETCDQVAVMYAGKIVETGDVNSVLESPKHPYTIGLLDCMPRMAKDRPPLGFIKGFIPNLVDPPPGCRFHPRCSRIKDVCRSREPRLVEVAKDHCAACFLYQE
jgi:oligopeptide/dipeptide ABC transporter ATP-binding protein